jgi:hypothetical protein
MDKFLAASGAYIGVLLLSLVYFILPAYSVGIGVDDLYPYLIVMLAPLAPIVLSMARNPVAVQHEMEVKAIGTVMIIISLFATFYYALPVFL